MPAAEIDREEELYWLALGLVPGLGPKRTVQLLERFDSPRSIFRVAPGDLMGAGLSGGIAHSIASGCTFDDAATQRDKMLAAGATLITYRDARYPKRLRRIFDPPPMLFVRGRTELLDTLMLGVVGTRRPTPYGQTAANRLSRDLARAGLTITSGMARGIDTSAHNGALETGGNTVAVFGCGVDLVYPAENRKLAETIAEKGLLVSEFPMGTPAYPQNFPVRNRIVSGLSIGVLVVEGAKYSGSSVTARLAIEQGRGLFAVPGNIFSKMSWGPNLLIKQGAKLVQEAEDVLAELPSEDRRMLAGMRVEDMEQKELIPDLESAAGRHVLASVRVDAATHIDAILEHLPQYSSSEVISALFELEMIGLIRQLAGKNFIRVL